MAASEFCVSMSALVKSILRLRIVLDPLTQISADNNNNNNNNNDLLTDPLGGSSLLNYLQIKLYYIIITITK